MENRLLYYSENNNTDHNFVLNINMQLKKFSRLFSVISERFSDKELLIAKRDFKFSHLESNDGNVLNLLAESNGVHPGSARFSRTENLLIVEMVDASKNLVIQSSMLDGGTYHPEDEANELMSQFGQLSWSTSGFEAISEHLWRLMRKWLGDNGGLWEARSLMMAKRVLRILTELRDAGLEDMSESSFRSYLPLDRLINLIGDERVSLAARKALSDYLVDLPGYEEAKAISGDLEGTCYSQHGYLMSIVINALGQLIPPSVLRYEYEIRAPFRKVDAEITPSGVLVTVRYHATKERFFLYPKAI